MATILRCDRCLREETKECYQYDTGLPENKPLPRMPTSIVPMVFSAPQHPGIKFTTRDLCGRCQEDIHMVMTEELPRKQQ